MKKTPTYSFTFDIDKLEAIVFIISYLSGYLLDEVEPDAMKILLADTNAEEDRWLEWRLNGSKCNILLELGQDLDAGWNYMLVYCPKELETQLRIMDAFQDLFKNLEPFWSFLDQSAKGWTDTRLIDT